jgi:hypothetical protein
MRFAAITFIVVLTTCPFAFERVAAESAPLLSPTCIQSITKLGLNISFASENSSQLIEIYTELVSRLPKDLLIQIKPSDPFDFQNISSELAPIQEGLLRLKEFVEKREDEKILKDELGRKLIEIMGGQETADKKSERARRIIVTPLEDPDIRTRGNPNMVFSASENIFWYLRMENGFVKTAAENMGNYARAMSSSMQPDVLSHIVGAKKANTAVASGKGGNYEIYRWNNKRLLESEAAEWLYDRDRSHKFFNQTQVGINSTGNRVIVLDPSGKLFITRNFVNGMWNSNKLFFNLTPHSHAEDPQLNGAVYAVYSPELNYALLSSFTQETKTQAPSENVSTWLHDLKTAKALRPLVIYEPGVNGISLGEKRLARRVAFDRIEISDIQSGNAIEEIPITPGYDFIPFIKYDENTDVLVFVEEDFFSSKPNLMPTHKDRLVIHIPRFCYTKYIPITYFTLARTDHFKGLDLNGEKIHVSLGSRESLNAKMLFTIDLRRTMIYGELIFSGEKK